LIGLAAPRAGITALSSAERCGVPLDAHASTLPNPTSALPATALRCTNSRRDGMTLSGYEVKDDHLHCWLLNDANTDDVETAA
jgi:hypothetical protein